MPQFPSTHYRAADTAAEGNTGLQRVREGEGKRERKRYSLVYINTSSILLVIAGLRSRRRHYHHISGNVEICLYVFGGKNNANGDGGPAGMEGGVEEIIRPRRVWGRLLVRDLLSMGKMIPAAAAGGPNGITDEYCSYNLSRRSLFVLILTISMDVFFLPTSLSFSPFLSFCRPRIPSRPRFYLFAERETP